MLAHFVPNILFINVARNQNFIGSGGGAQVGMAHCVALVGVAHWWGWRSTLVTIFTLRTEHFPKSCCV